MQHCITFYYVLHHRSRQYVSQLRVASVAITPTAAVVEVHLDDDSLVFWHSEVRSSGSPSYGRLTSRLVASD